MQSTIRSDLPVSKLGSEYVRTRTITSSNSPYRLSDADGVVYVNASGGSVTVSLPTQVNRQGKSFTVVRTDSTVSNSVTVNPYVSTETINGVSSYSLPVQYATAVFQSSGTAWIVVSEFAAPVNGATGFFGNGGDGALLYNGSSTVLGIVPSSNTYTLNRDIYGTTLTVNSGVTIITAGFRIFANVALLNSGTIRANGGNGGNAAASTVGAAGAASAAGTLGNGGVGKAGVTNAVGTAGTSVTAAVGAAGGAGGSATNAGGAAGTATNPTAVQGGAQCLQCVVSALHGRANDNTQILGGASGGSGGSSGTSAWSGGSGAGGGVILLSSPVIDVLSGATVSALGGNGGNGFESSGSSGGGGGGGGGVIIIVYNGPDGYTNAGTVSVAGGSGGTKAGSGNNGSAGTTGTIVQIQN